MVQKPRERSTQQLRVQFSYEHESKLFAVAYIREYIGFYTVKGLGFKLLEARLFGDYMGD